MSSTPIHPHRSRSAPSISERMRIPARDATPDVPAARAPAPSLCWWVVFGAAALAFYVSSLGGGGRLPLSGDHPGRPGRVPPRVADRSFPNPPILSALLWPWTEAGPETPQRPSVPAIPILTIVLALLCIATAWRAFGRTGPIDWLVLAGLVALSCSRGGAAGGEAGPAILAACATTAALLLLLRLWDWQTGVAGSLLVLWAFATCSQGDTYRSLGVAALGIVLLVIALLLLFRGHVIPACIGVLLALAGGAWGMVRWGALSHWLSMGVVLVLLATGILFQFQRWCLASSAAFGLALLWVLATRGGMSLNSSLSLAAVMALTMCFVYRHSDWVFGAVFALAILLSPGLLLLVPWLLLRRRVRPFATTLLFLIVWVGIWVWGGGVGSPFPALQVASVSWLSALAMLVGYGVLGLLLRRNGTAPRVVFEYGLVLVAGVALFHDAWPYLFPGLAVVWGALYAALRYRLSDWRRWMGLGLLATGWALYAGLGIYREGLLGLLTSHPASSLIPAAIMLLMAHAPTPEERRKARASKKPLYCNWDSFPRPSASSSLPAS